MVHQRDILLQGSKGGSLEAWEFESELTGASIRVAKFGGTLYSYKDANGEERIFTSAETNTDRSKPIRGGIPLVFPQFGEGELVKHGFARVSEWVVEDTPTEEDGVVTVAFVSRDNELSKDWPHKYKLVHNVVFGAAVLQTSLHITNTGDEDFEFQGLLHTYYKLAADISELEVKGLEGVSYIDQLKKGETFTEENEVVKFTEETDRIYTSVKGPIEVSDGNGRIQLDVSFGKRDDKEDHMECDLVVWNPWIEKSKGLGDFGPEEYHNMVCLEPGCVSRKQTCKPGETYFVTQIAKFSTVE
mmetsp:Transcript_835/g.1911  ORF Transcript_835/g.1911 Transcript_835/m.1911 type:complete len:301 (-) Transcript_835:347-1249(-)|eukprot:CAMPEP_0171501344 /NCGR_PEP_ID=MMETSP0958-20121227/9505_1 /TAXON_ID=87120 /ORGANISM="Aurantiochytrium limacinum, Strain ATCCMYA-1381" /LENGTH=300 /DNA_ID=CAMNT_0012036147 /DNA_START=57 /DNA_END=959 /DNA_ORIENTATION=-